MAPILDETGQDILDELSAAEIYDEAGPGVPQEYELQRAPHLGLGLGLSTPVNGDTAVPTPKAGLLLWAGSAPFTMSLPSGFGDDGLPLAPQTLTVGPGEAWTVPLPPAVYGFTAITIGYSGDTTEALAGYFYIA
jgi:hypothetical protein